jgi:ACS family tartrate transporter-like MFS transporter
MHSDRTSERRLHIALPLLFMASGLVGCAVLPSPVLAICALALVPIGMGALLGPIYSLPCQLLRGKGAAAGIALAAALANVGGLIGPYLIGFLKDATGGYVLPLLLIAGFVTIAAVIALRLRLPRPMAMAPSPA